MRFSKAIKGIKLLFVSEFFNIASLVFLLMSSVFVLFVTDEITPEKHPKAFFAMMTLIVIYIGFGILSFLLQFIGLLIARKDEPMFSRCILFVVICAVSTVMMLFASGVFNKINISIEEISNLLIYVYIILGIYTIYERTGDKAMMLVSKLFMLLVTIFYAFIFVMHFAIAIVPELDESLGVVTAVLELLSSVFFLIYLGVVKRMMRLSEREALQSEAATVTEAAAETA